MAPEKSKSEWNIFFDLIQKEANYINRWLEDSNHFSLDNMKKSIWIINQYVGSPTHGMEFRHYYLAKEFIKKGYDVFVFSGSFSHLYKKQPTDQISTKLL